MAKPAFPTGAWDVDLATNDAVKFNVYENQFGGGYTQRIGANINSTRNTYGATWTNLTDTEMQLIYNFLRAQGGYIAFDYKIPGDDAVRSWTARDIKLHPVGKSDDITYWSVACTLKEEFDTGQIRFVYVPGVVAYGSAGSFVLSDPSVLLVGVSGVGHAMGNYPFPSPDQWLFTSGIVGAQAVGHAGLFGAVSFIGVQGVGHAGTLAGDHPSGTLIGVQATAHLGTIFPSIAYADGFDSATAVNTTITNSNFTATHANTSAGGAKVPTSHSSGKWYFEISTDAVTIPHETTFGLLLSTGAFADMVTSIPTNSAVVRGDNLTIYSDGAVQSLYDDGLGLQDGSGANGKVYLFAVDLDNGLWWVRQSGSSVDTWNGDTSTVDQADPALGRGGFPLPLGEYFPAVAFASGTSPDAFTIHSQPSSMVGQIPYGFSYWIPPLGGTMYGAIGYGYAGQLFNAWSYFENDTRVNVTLNNNHVVAVADLGTQGGVRSIHYKRSGKIYFEMDPNSGSIREYSGAGLLCSDASYDDGRTPVPTNCAIIRRIGPSGLGSIFANDIDTGIALGQFNQGDEIGIAVDFNTWQIWFRNLSQSGGHWNANVSANPDTGAFGISIDKYANKVLSPAFISNSVSSNEDEFTFVADPRSMAGPGLGLAPTTFKIGWDRTIDKAPFIGVQGIGIAGRFVTPFGVITGVQASAQVGNLAIADQWNPSDHASVFGLSAGNFTATTSSATQGGARSYKSKYQGRIYTEFAVSGFDSTCAVGIASPTTDISLPSVSGVFNHSVIIAGNGHVIIFGSDQGAAMTSFTSANIGMAIDFDNGLVWFRKDGGLWNNSVDADPIFGIGGLTAGTLFGGVGRDAMLGVVSSNSGAAATIIDGGDLVYTAPDGYINGWYR